MEEVRNSLDKLVCRINKATKTVEIVLKGCITTICFLENGQAIIKNARKAA